MSCVVLHRVTTGVLYECCVVLHRVTTGVVYECCMCGVTQGDYKSVV